MKSVYLYTGHPSRAHPVHQESTRYPPEGYAYIPSADYFFKEKRRAQYTAHVGVSSLLTGLSPRFLSLVQSMRLPNVRWIRVPRHTSLIHSGQYALLNQTPWMMDFENAAVLGWFDRRVIDTPAVKTFFQWLFTRDSCRGLLAWTTAAKQSMEQALDCSAFAHKLYVVHHTIIPQPWVDRSFSHSPVRLLFCSGNFYYKGGLDAILAAIQASADCNIHLTVVSQYPEEIQQRYGNHPAITLYRSLPTAQRHELLRNTDILLHPGHSETYGYVMIEAFSYGIPVISTDGFSAPELIDDGVRGQVVKNYCSWFDARHLPWVRTAIDRQRFYEQLLDPPREYIQRLSQAIVKLARSPELRQSMSRNAFESVTQGIFSPQRRKQALEKIYGQ